MAKRSKRGQAKHDAKVRQEANRLRRQGWDVQADLPGFDRPDPIGRDKKTPDIRATKRGAERIVEVETPDTVDKDRDQHGTFRRRVGHRPRSTFEIVETD